MAATTPPRHAQELTEGKGQALQALINSISPNSFNPGAPTSKITPEQLKSITEKLGEIVGNSGTEGLRNDKGEVVNEEGLPIIEITEPATNTNLLSLTADPADTLDDNFPLSFDTLSSSEQERIRRERDRILDELEAEEAAIPEGSSTEKETDAAAVQEKKEQEAKQDLEKLKAVREMHKKMGKALMKDLKLSREREEVSKQQELNDDLQLEKNRRGYNQQPKKRVSFAELPKIEKEDEDEDSVPEKWGDIAVGRLRSSKKVFKTPIEKHPMKMNVVERAPSSTVSDEPSLPEADSDDESQPGSTTPSDPDEDNIAHNGVHGHDSLSSSDPTSTDDTGEEIEEDEYDFDEIRHQREIALEYYKSRGTIGLDAYEALTSHTHDDEAKEDESNIMGIPQPREKPALSRFKADRLASSYGATLPKSSVGPTILPASSQEAIQRSIRLGKLENGQLVGGESGESGSEDGEMQEVLGKFKIENTRNIASVDRSKQAQSVPPTSEPTLLKATVSRFKADRATSNSKKLAEINAAESGPATPMTPLTTDTRSSPKLTDFVSSILNPSSQQPPTIMPKPNADDSSTSSSQVPSWPPSVMPSTMPSMIVESPSYPRTPVSRPERPPTIVAAAVREKIPESNSGTTKVAEPLARAPPRRISRFKAERM